MRAIVQRVSRASVSSGGEEVATIGTGLLVLLGVREGDVARGNRPSFTDAAPPSVAEPLYERMLKALDARGGRFGAHMEVSLVNYGPVTLIVDV